jgi:hypothetical protein
VPGPESPWFLPAFVVFWLAICGALSLVAGWHALAQRFASRDAIEGERFRFRSGGMGWRSFPVAYGNCFFATVGLNAFSLSVLFPFRFLHPRLVIPWTEVERCEATRIWIKKCVVVHVRGFDRCLLLNGELGQAVLQAWTRSRAPLSQPGS